MIPNAVLEQLAGARFDKAQVIIVTKMLLVTAENVRNQMRSEMREELAAMRGDYGRLIIEAVEATEAKIFARLEAEKAKQEEAKRLKREAAAARKREREAASNGGGTQSGGSDGAGNVARGLIDDENKSDIKTKGKQACVVDVAAKFEDNPAYKELMAEWETKAAADKPQKPIGSPMSAMKSLGEAMLASWKKQLEEEEAEKAQEGADLPMIESGLSDEGQYLEAAQ